MATNPHVASMPVAAPLPPLSLRQILLVHLIVFQEAVFGCHIQELEIVEWLRLPLQIQFSVCLFTLNKDSIPRLPDMSQIIANRVYRACIMWMRCDAFCAIMQPFVNQHLKELLGLNYPTEWRRFRAIPELLLVLEPRDLHHPAGHSILVITDGHGEKHIFDGTIDQYGRNWRTHWLMTEEELMRSHLDLSQVPYFQESFGDETVRAEVMGMESEHGYWAVASRRMKKIFREVDWSYLRGCAEDEIEAQIRSLSKANFVGAYEESLAQ